MAPDEEELDDLMKQIRNLKRRRNEISGDTDRILTEQRQLDMDAIEVLNIRDARDEPSPVQRREGRLVTCVCGKAVPANFKHCPHCGKALQ